MIHADNGLGCNNSVLPLFQLFIKLLMYKGGHPEKPRILLLAPTGLATINIDGTKIHTALGIPVGI